MTLQEDGNRHLRIRARSARSFTRLGSRFCRSREAPLSKTMAYLPTNSGFPGRPPIRRRQRFCRCCSASNTVQPSRLRTRGSMSDRPHVLSATRVPPATPWRATRPLLRLRDPDGRHHRRHPAPEHPPATSAGFGGDGDILIGSRDTRSPQHRRPGHQRRPRCR